MIVGQELNLIGIVKVWNRFELTWKKEKDFRSALGHWAETSRAYSQSAGVAHLTEGRAAHGAPGPKPAVAEATRAGQRWRARA
jgi:hypothetical protein